jgi:hypothetical protein
MFRVRFFNACDEFGSQSLAICRAKKLLSINLGFGKASIKAFL